MQANLKQIISKK